MLGIKCDIIAAYFQIKFSRFTLFFEWIDASRYHFIIKRFQYTQTPYPPPTYTHVKSKYNMRLS